MNEVATALKAMLAAGVPDDVIVDAIAKMVDAIPRAETPEERRKRVSREASARFRAKNGDGKTSPDVTGRHQVEVTRSDVNASPVTEIRHRTSPPRVRVEDITLTTVLEDTQEAKASFVSDAEPRKPKALPKGSRLPADWTPSDLDRQFAIREGLTAPEIDRAADEFRDYWAGATGRSATKLDWSATWRNRIRQLADRASRPRMASAPGQPRVGRPVSASFADIRARRRAEAPVSDDVPVEWRVL